MMQYPELTPQQSHRIIVAAKRLANRGWTAHDVRLFIVSKCRDDYGFWIREEQLQNLLKGLS